MLKLEMRPEPSKTMAIASPLLALVITVLIGTALFVMLGKDPLRGLQVFFIEPVKSGYALSELAMKATPLLLIALGLSLIFSLGGIVNARPGDVFSLECLEYRRRRPVHRWRDRCRRCCDAG